MISVLHREQVHSLIVDKILEICSIKSLVFDWGLMHCNSFTGIEFPSSPILNFEKI
jgi:hypothetical protein